MKKNKIIMIVVNYNNYTDTIRCVNELVSYSAIDAVIVVDNYSNNSSVKKIKEAFEEKISLIELKNNSGYASGNNAGIKFAIEKFGSECIIFVSNPDVSVDQEVIKNVASFIQQNKDEAGIVAPRGDKFSAWKYPTISERLMVESKIWTFIFRKTNGQFKYYKHHKNVQPVDVLSGAFFAMYGKTWKEIGYFDDHTFLYYEEEILYKKLKLIGKQNYQLGDNFFHHVGQSSTAKNNILETKRMNESRNYLLKEYENINFIQKMGFYIMGNTNVAFSALLNLKRRISFK